MLVMIDLKAKRYWDSHYYARATRNIAHIFGSCFPDVALQRSTKSMGELTKRVIERIETAKAVEDLDTWIWKASDLLAKSHFERYHSGFAEIDDEIVSPEENARLRDALCQALSRNSDPRFVSQIIGALGSAQDASLRRLFISYLADYLKQLKACNGVVHSALRALDQIDEPVYEREPDGRSSQSRVDIDKNVRQAHRYLESHGFLIPW